MKSLDIIKQFEDLLKSGKLQHDLSELQQLRKQTNIPLGLQVIYHDGKDKNEPSRYTIRLTMNSHKFESTFKADLDRHKHSEAVKQALFKVINNAVTSYILDDAQVSTLLNQHFK